MNKNGTEEIKKLKDKTFVLTTIIPKQAIQSKYQEILAKVSQKVEIKGFRAGKAPLDMVNDKVDPEKLLNEVAQELIPSAYYGLVKKHQLRPIIQPQIKIINPPVSQDNDWQIEITGCELPEISLGDYQAKIEKNKAKLLKSDKVRDAIIDQIILSAQLELPPILVETEVNHRLSDLVDQTAQAGITLNQYLKSKNSSLEQLKEDYKRQVVQEWTLNLALDQIAKDQKIEVTPDDLKKISEESHLPLNDQNRGLLSYVSLQRKTLDFLEGLIKKA